MEGKTFSRYEAAKYLGVTERTFRQWVQKIGLQPATISANGARFYSREQLDELKSKITTGGE